MSGLAVNSRRFLTPSFRWVRGRSVLPHPARYSVHSIASGLGPVCVAKGANPRDHRRPVQQRSNDQEIMPATLLPVEEICEQHNIYTNARDPDSIINTKLPNTVTHRKKDFSLPLVAYIVSGEPHIHRMYQ